MCREGRDGPWGGSGEGGEEGEALEVAGREEDVVDAGLGGPVGEEYGARVISRETHYSGSLFDVPGIGGWLSGIWNGVKECLADGMHLGRDVITTRTGSNYEDSFSERMRRAIVY